MFGASKKSALGAIIIVLGGFAAARVVGYAVDGVDADANRAFGQTAVFLAEIAGATAATFWRYSLDGESRNKHKAK